MVNSDAVFQPFWNQLDLISFLSSKVVDSSLPATVSSSAIAVRSSITFMHFHITYNRVVFFSFMPVAYSRTSQSHVQGVKFPGYYREKSMICRRNPVPQLAVARHHLSKCNLCPHIYQFNSKWMSNSCQSGIQETLATGHWWWTDVLSADNLLKGGLKQNQKKHTSQNYCEFKLSDLLNQELVNHM